jgi:hypothetical protein
MKLFNFVLLNVTLFFIISAHAGSMITTTTKSDDPCVKDRYHDFIDLKQTQNEIEYNRNSLNPPTTDDLFDLFQEIRDAETRLCQHIDDATLEEAKNQITSAADSASFTQALMRLRVFHACGSDHFDGSKEMISDFVINQNKKRFHTACTDYWTNQILCIWNMKHDKQRSLLPQSTVPSECPTLEEVKHDAPTDSTGSADPAAR